MTEAAHILRLDGPILLAARTYGMGISKRLLIIYESCANPFSGYMYNVVCVCVMFMGECRGVQVGALYQLFLKEISILGRFSKHPT